MNEKEWNSIVGKDRMICTYKYLNAIEKSEINDCRYYYPVVYEEGRIIAHACVYFISTELDAFAQGITKKIIDLIRRKWKGFFVLRSLECGTPVALGSTVSFREGINQAEVLSLMRREIENLAKKLNIGVVLFRDFYDEELGVFDNLTEAGYNRIHNLSNTKLEIRWKSFDEYLNSMRSNYRMKIIKRMKKCHRENVTIQVLRNFSRYADELERLWTNVYYHATEYRRERLTAVFFRNIDQYLGERSGIILVKEDNMPIGFGLLLFDDETLTSMFFGINYDYNKDHFIYFNLLYKVVEVAIEEGMNDIDMGITTLVPKKDIGFAVAPLNMYMKHFNPLLNKIVPRAFEMMTPQDNTGPRRVFKTDRQEIKKEAKMFNKTESFSEQVSIKTE
ncbi:GNAT family N-acetyltransferase [Patescibacteria group bacterium]|nr:GNAT family N-acetyltransferase [Patescibacteria group bacterium]